MRRRWSKEEIGMQWCLSPKEFKLLRNKTGPTRLGFAILLKFFHIEGRFPDTPSEVPLEAIWFLADALAMPSEAWWNYPWEGRVHLYHRSEIRNWFGFRKSNQKDLKSLSNWLLNSILDHEYRTDRLHDSVLEHCRTLFLEPPATEQIRRIIRSALQNHEGQFSERICQQLPASTRQCMNELLLPLPADENNIQWTSWQNIKADPGKIGLESLKNVVERLRQVREIAIPGDLFADVPPKLLERYAKRASIEEPFELRRHGEKLRATLLASYLYRRSEELTDHLVDLLIEIVHKMGKKAEQQIDESLGVALQKAPNKMVKLYRMAKVSIDSPKGVIENVIFPAVPEKWLLKLIKEVETGSGYKGSVKSALQRSYRSHYRRMLPDLLVNLEFRCTNSSHQPVMEALSVVKAYLTHKATTYPIGIEIPLKGVVSSSWRPLVVEHDDADTPQINRISYEICTLKALREQLRCREIWVVGSRRYRDPEEDLPQDFETRRADYYADLGIPLDAKEFTASIKAEMTAQLTSLNNEILTNPLVKIIYLVLYNSQVMERQHLAAICTSKSGGDATAC